MRYKTEDGEVVEATSPSGIVEALRDGSRFASHQSVEEYMEAFAERMFEWNEQQIRCDSPESFVSELVRVGWLRPIQ